MSSAAGAAAISLWKERSYILSAYGWGVVLVFAYTTLTNMTERPDGIVIASCFIVFILTVSIAAADLKSGRKMASFWWRLPKRWPRRMRSPI